MRKRATASALTFVLLLAGCIPSLHPLYTEQDLIFDPALLGQWINEKEIWNITREGERSYRVAHIDENQNRGDFIGHLLKVDGTMFVDLLPVKHDEHHSGLYRDQLLTTHTFFMVVRTEPTPQFAFLDGDWLRRHLKANPAALRHESLNLSPAKDDEIVITASSKELQRFLLSHLKTEGAFKANAPWRAQDRLTPW